LQFAGAVQLLRFGIEKEGANRVLHLPAVIDLDAEVLAGHRAIGRQERLGPGIVAVKVEMHASPKAVVVASGSGVNRLTSIGVAAVQRSPRLGRESRRKEYAAGRESKTKRAGQNPVAHCSILQGDQGAKRFLPKPIDLSPIPQPGDARPGFGSALFGES
jgi:hypothetical protein